MQSPSDPGTKGTISSPGNKAAFLWREKNKKQKNKSETKKGRPSWKKKARQKHNGRLDNSDSTAFKKKSPNKFKKYSEYTPQRQQHLKK